MRGSVDGPSPAAARTGGLSGRHAGSCVESRVPVSPRSPRSLRSLGSLGSLRSVRALLALVAGGLLSVAFPTAHVWVAAPLAMVLLAFVLTGTGARKGFMLGLTAGVAFFLPSLHWSGIYVGPVPWVALSLLEAFFLALSGALYGWLSRCGRVRPVAFALAWVVAESVRARAPYGGFPWLKVAFSQADSPFGRLVAVGGTPGVALVIALTGALAAVAAQQALRADRAGRARPPAGVVRAVPALGVAVALTLSGYAVPLPVEGPTAQFLGVQGNVPRAGLDFNSARRAVLDNHVDATARAHQDVTAGRAPRPDLVVWPENASDIDPPRNADARSRIEGTVAAVGVPLVVGGLLEEPANQLSNVALLFEPGRGNTARYVKQHPVPFAEYIPNRAFWRLIISQVDLVRRDIVAGAGGGIFSTTAASGVQIRAGLAICFEVAYDALMRDAVEQGANVLLVQTNNATFGFTAESPQQLAISRVRAMEFGRSVVHVSTVGQSALIRPDGTVLQTTELFTQAVVRGALPLRVQRTPATRLGGLPDAVATAVLVVLVAARLRSGSRGGGKGRFGGGGAGRRAGGAKWWSAAGPVARCRPRRAGPRRACGSRVRGRPGPDVARRSLWRRTS